MDADQAAVTKLFIDNCRRNPAILSHPSVAFFRDFLESVGANLPSTAYTVYNQEEHRNWRMAEESEEDYDDDSTDSFESDIEFEDEIVYPDDGPFQEAVYPDPSFKVDEKIHDATQLAKGKAIKAISEGKLDEALGHLTAAIVLNPKSSMLYSTRAPVYIKMKKPNAAILDAHTALQINPNYAKGYKSRGLALNMLGDWGQAVKDLHLASCLDHDEEIDTALKMDRELTEAFSDPDIMAALQDVGQ